MRLYAKQGFSLLSGYLSKNLAQNLEGKWTKRNVIPWYDYH
jgi:hypothetical protein